MTAGGEITKLAEKDGYGFYFVPLEISEFLDGLKTIVPEEQLQTAKDAFTADIAKVNAMIIEDFKAAEYRNHMIGFIFQSFNLISFKTAVENVELPLFYQGVSRKKRHTLALEYLERLGLLDWATHYPNELSGGQRQRVAIARALITQPQIILADEPTGALDSKTSVEVMQLLKQLNAEEHITQIIVTHDSGVAQQTNRIIRIKDGVIE